MASNQDARPFVDLQKDANEFRAKFEEDIEKCKSLLDAKITSLICDPDSLGTLVGPKQNTQVAFSRAKYEVYISMKSYMNDLEREWFKYISEMKKLFLENVEIFLAGTKLEVKLPESQPSATRKSPGNKKTSTAGSSLYPILSTIAKNIPVFSSPTRNKEIQNIRSEQITRGYFSQSSDMEIDETEIVASRLDNIERSKSQSPNHNLGQSNLQGRISKYASSSESLEEIDELESESSIKPAVKVSSRSKSAAVSKKMNSNTSDENDSGNSAPPLRGRRGKQTAISEENTKGISKINYNSTSDENEDIKNSVNEDPVPLKSRKGRQTVRNQVNAEAISVTNTTSTLYENVKGSVSNTGPVPLKSRRGRQATKALVNTEVKSSGTTSDEHDDENNKVPVIVKSRRGRQAAKDVVNAEVKNNCNMPDEHKVVNNEVPLIVKSRRGRQATKDLANAEVNNGCNTSDEHENVNKEVPIPLKSRRGKQVSKSQINANGTSVSPPKMMYTARDDSDDEDESNIEDVRSLTSRVATKSSARRKTLLPNMNNIEPVADDIIPGNPSRVRSKRKTISSVSVVAPPKRLKSSGIQRSTIRQDEVASANDNLLESNDGYSEWIPLKNIDGKVPAGPGIYEVKERRAKKTAHIGFCDSLRQKLTLHKLQENSGHKQLDKFINRNFNDIHVRYEAVSSISEAKNEVKTRINSFINQHKTNPAYN